MLYLVVDAILNIWIISCRRKCFDLIIILAVHVFIVISVTQRLIHIIHNSEHPASCFVSLDTGTILVSDLLFDVLMSKLTAAKTGRESFYQQRKGFRVKQSTELQKWGPCRSKVWHVKHIILINRIYFVYPTCILWSNCNFLCFLWLFVRRKPKGNKNGQSTETGNNGYTKHKTKTN